MITQTSMGQQNVPSYRVSLYSVGLPSLCVLGSVHIEHVIIG